MMPLYSEIERDLVSKIQRGELVPDEPIPTELELCEMYGVSRITVRRAVERLVAARMIYRRRGIGTFVNRPDGDGKSLRLVGHIKDVLTFDRKLTARILRRGPETPPPAVQSAFEIAKGEKLYAISAINYLDRKPYAVTHSFFAPALSRVAHKVRMRHGKTSIQYVEELTGIRVRSGEQTIEPDGRARPHRHAARIEIGNSDSHDDAALFLRRSAADRSGPGSLPPGPLSFAGRASHHR